MTDQIILGCLIALVIILTGTIWWLANFSRRLSNDLENIKKNTAIQVNNNVPVIEYRDSNIKDLVTKRTVFLDIYEQSPDDVKEQMMRMITRDLAESLVPFIDIREETDYYRRERVYHARVRVVGK